MCEYGALRASLDRSAEWRASVQLSWFSYRVPSSAHRQVEELGKWLPNISIGRRTSRSDFVIACVVDVSGRRGIGNRHKLRGLIVRDEPIRGRFYGHVTCIPLYCRDVTIYREFHSHVAELVTKCSENTLLRDTVVRRRILLRCAFP